MRLPHPPRIGGLFEGYGGLTMATEDVFGGELVWYAEFDGLPTEKKPFLHGASRILNHRFPGVPNHGDVTKIDWAALRGTIDILTGGSPCQDLSHAGKRAGMTEGTRSNLWVAMREAIAIIRPSIVIWENVRGAFTAEADSDLVADPRLLAEVRRRDGEPVLRAAGRVVGDLCELGYDAGWITIRAADVGAPHGRPRVFVVATDTACDPWWLEHGDGGAAADTGGEARLERAGLREGEPAGVGRGRPADGGGALPDGAAVLPTVMKTLPTPSARDYKDHTIRREPHRPDDVDTLARALTDVPAAGIDPGPPGELLPTPAVNDMGDNKTVEWWDEWAPRQKGPEGKGGGHGKSLAIEAKRTAPLLPTPAGTGGGQTSRSGDRIDEPLLGGIVQQHADGKLLPTPNTQDAKGAGSAASRDDGRQAQLHDTVKKLLPTPVVADAESARNSTAGRAGGPTGHEGDTLLDWATKEADRLLPTPVATEGRKGDYSESAESRRSAGHAVYIANAVRSVDDALELEECQDFAVEAVDDDDDVELALLPTPLVGSSSPAAHGQISGQYRDAMNEALARWGAYAPAISRWEGILERPAPEPTMQSKNDRPQLAPRFVEWMMGLPDGWVCDVPGITRNEALRALGNGVCPQQAAHAIRTVLSWFRANAA